MWQVQFLIAMERERERQRELEVRRLLADAVRSSGRRPRGIVPALRRLLRGAGAAVASIGAAVDRQVIGAHHL